MIITKFKQALLLLCSLRLLLFAMTMFPLMLVVFTYSSNSYAKQSSCEILITETRSACMDMARQNLNFSCSKYLMVVNMAMDQADGNLFDVGSDNESTANSFCQIHVDKLRNERKKNENSDLITEQSGPACSALADHFDTQCMLGLGKEKLSRKCKTIGKTFENFNLKQLPQETRETLCSITET